MTLWTLKKLGEVADIIDCPHSTPKWANEGIFVVRNFNLSNGRIVRDKSSFTDYETYVSRTKRAIPRQGDIILSREAPIGQVGYIHTNEKLCLGQRVVLIKPKKIQSRFLLYQLISPFVQAQFNKSNGSGSTVSNLRIPFIKNTYLNCPDEISQKHIASLLSAYDELIEKNERQIKILEEMAQRLYTEWFIKFKFPEHEKVKIVNGLPENWEYKRVDEVAKVIRGTSYSSEEINDELGDYYLVNLKSFNRGGGFKYEGKKYFSGSINNNQLLIQGDIVVAVTDMTTDRAVIARPARIPHIKNQKITFSADVVKISSHKVPPTFTYYCLLDYRFTETTKHKANGANVLHLKPQAISEYKILIPNSDLIEKFEKLTIRITHLIDKLSEKNEKLNKIRDLLIPQLVTGKRELKN